MKVVLLTHDTRIAHGIGRYSSEVYNRLKDFCDAEMIGNYSIPQYLDDLFYIPAKIIKKLRNENIIYHALSPREAIYLPLVKRSVVTFHDILPLTKYHYPKSIFAQYFYKICWKVASKCKHIVADSSLTKEELIKRLKIEPEKITVINLGINEKFQPMKKKYDKFVVGYLGSFVKRKRVDIVINSFKLFQEKYPDINCELIIGGEKSKHLQSFDVKNLTKGMKNVKILGFVPENEIVKVYNMFNVFVYPCEYDGWSLPILEAQSCGIPVIVKRSSQLPQEIKKFTIQCENEEEIADVIYKLLTDKSYVKKVTSRALNYVRRFSWKEYIKKLLKVYQKLV
jgi:glycosyltransferase involved in cell wall biosynthesis